MPEQLRIQARDGVALGGELFLPEGAPRAAVLIASAMAVRARFYAPFAASLARQGLAALTLDYRGVGLSRDKTQPLKACKAQMHDWGELDLAAALQALAARAPGVPLTYVGHSAGGQLLGLIEKAPVARALFVASQSGYFRLWPGAGSLVMGALWHALIPAACAVTGILPMRALGQGEDVPRGVGLEWAKWGRHPRYLGSYADARGGLGFKSYRGAIRSLVLSDDSYAPEPAARGLLALYENATSELRVLKPQDAGAPAIGHFGFFKPRFEAALWEPAARYLLTGS